MLSHLRSVRLLRNFVSNKCVVHIRELSDNKSSEIDGSNVKDEIKITGLAEALGKFRKLEKPNEVVTIPPEEKKSFLHLLRHSEFVQMGDPHGKIVIGKIFQVVNTDLYVDFGGKFHCVCRKPKRNAELYVRGAEVKLRINETELCARFLGATEDLTLTEACGTLLDIVKTPVNTISLKP